MVFLIYLCHILIIASSDVPPKPPQNVEVDYDQVKWTSADQDDTTYSVQYQLFDEYVWRNVSSCEQISGSFCNVTSARLDALHGCLDFQVYAQRKGVKSEAVEACSRRDVCAPRVRLSSRPGSLGVHLGRDHELAEAYQDHMEYKLCYHKPGQSVEFCRESLGSDVVTELDEGETYCVNVQFLHFSRAVGVPSCSQCEDIPLSGSRLSSSWIIAVVISVVMVGSIVVYVIFFYRIQVKAWFRLEQTPDSLTVALHDISLSTPTEEHFDSLQIRERERD